LAEKSKRVEFLFLNVFVVLVFLCGKYIKKGPRDVLKIFLNVKESLISGNDNYFNHGEPKHSVLG
jgi:hypothetical protein